MEVYLKVQGTERLNKKMQRYARDLERKLESVLAQEARAACVSLGFRTQPYGFGEDQSKFERKVAADIRKVYLDRDAIYAITEMIKPRSMNLALGFYRASKAGDLKKANLYLRQAGFKQEVVDPQLHRAARTGKAGSVAKNTRPQAIVRKPSLAKYIRAKQKTIGTAKGGWYAAAKSLGGRVRRNLVDADTGKRSTEEIFPAYVRKLANKFKTLGGSRVMPGRVEVFTSVEHADEALPPMELETAVAAARESFTQAMLEGLRAIRIKHFRDSA